MKFTIRPITKEDCKAFETAFKKQGWDSKTEVMFIEYFKQQRQGTRKVFVAEFQGQLLGYTTMLREASEGPFLGKRIPEIVDLNVLEEFQHLGVGSALLDACEREAMRFSDCICLGVGLHSGYGKAQRLYVKRGYVFDGSGIWYNGVNLEEYQSLDGMYNDDGLTLYMKKQLKVTAHEIDGLVY